MDDRFPFRAERIALAEGTAVIEVEGEVDIYTSPRFGEVLGRSVDESAHHVVVDLTNVTFIDSTAISVLMQEVKRVRFADGTLTVVCGRGSVRRVLEIAGLGRVLRFCDTRGEALSGAGCCAGRRSG